MQPRPLIIDLGTYTTKVGFSPQDFSQQALPQLMVPTLVGQTKLLPGRLSDVNAASGQQYFGFEALRRSSVLSLKYPMEHGIVMDWDEIGELLNYCVRDCMKCDFESLTSGIMLTESPLNPKRHKELMTQTLFESFNVPKMQISMNALNALYSEALQSGLVLECGEGLTSCVPIVDGYVLHQSVQRLDLGGRDVNEHLMELLKHKVVFSSTFEREFVRDIKEQCCFVRECAGDGVVSEKKRYQLPDGRIIDLSQELHEAPEVLFNSTILGRDEGQNVQNLVVDALASCEVDCRKVLSQNLIVCGGGSMFRGFSERLASELAGKATPLKEKPYRRYMSWIGAAVLASLSSFEAKWITKGEYQEYGSAIIHKKALY
ncbi:hypothetical protein FGO68_gene7504 [Halteria grandinella]|uniref:Actin, cytoplasmic n=1 Tax=Halteria grandinella TaxID=5974 RepID=A0A8J8NP26_HALGN|nr:hypothetical protein FGO68_gene7504 [Halteria grandinella]